jgi:hypothetical protein
MPVILWLPVALLGAVFVVVCGVSGWIELAERRRMRIIVAFLSRRRRVFRPVVIQGGRTEAPVERNVDKLAG